MTVESNNKSKMDDSILMPPPPPRPPRLPKRQKTEVTTTEAADAGKVTDRPESISIPLPPLRFHQGEKKYFESSSGVSNRVAERVASDAALGQAGAAPTVDQSRIAPAFGDALTLDSVEQNESVFPLPEEAAIGPHDHDYNPPDAANVISATDDSAEQERGEGEQGKGKSRQPSRAAEESVSFHDIIGHRQAKLRLDEALLPLALPPDLADSVLTGPALVARLFAWLRATYLCPNFLVSSYLVFLRHRHQGGPRVNFTARLVARH